MFVSVLLINLKRNWVLTLSPQSYPELSQNTAIAAFASFVAESADETPLPHRFIGDNKAACSQ
jgi:hypothetical protein